MLLFAEEVAKENKKKEKETPPDSVIRPVETFARV